MVFGPATIGADGFEVRQPLDTMVFQWFPMVGNHWSNDGMVTIHRRCLIWIIWNSTNQGSALLKLNDVHVVSPCAFACALFLTCFARRRKSSLCYNQLLALSLTGRHFSLLKPQKLAPALIKASVKLPHKGLCQTSKCTCTCDDIDSQLLCCSVSDH